MPDHIFDVVAENPQKQHIAEKVHKIAVHKHRTQKIEIDGQRRRVMRNLRRLSADVYQLRRNNINAGRDLLRHERKSVGKRLVAAQTLQKHKNQYINCDKRVINKRRNYPVMIFIA